MNPPFELLWSDEARLTFNRLPIDVQAAFLKQLPQLITKYAQLYKDRTDPEQVVGTVSHMQVPDWGMWLRMGTDYNEYDDEPVLLIYELEELTSQEFEQSVREAQIMPGRINPKRQ
ncbi:hypothetical protein [Fibrella aquatilis]|uniref:Uncharacterized protein n=1 Tax=Fibrella aquatilis TaxID=2817059 RepID=A0A939K149_9BACT|nr:hypothetical protein [Fibrella aquatilis]MBO0931900.1 hypothetical protein [Fibrella aquatilis]